MVNTTPANQYYSAERLGRRDKIGGSSNDAVKQPRKADLASSGKDIDKQPRKEDLAGSSQNAVKFAEEQGQQRDFEAMFQEVEKLDLEMQKADQEKQNREKQPRTGDLAGSGNDPDSRRELREGNTPSSSKYDSGIAQMQLRETQKISLDMQKMNRLLSALVVNTSKVGPYVLLSILPLLPLTTSIATSDPGI